MLTICRTLMMQPAPDPAISTNRAGLSLSMVDQVAQLLRRCRDAA